MAQIPSSLPEKMSFGTLLHTYLGILVALWTLLNGISLWFGLESTYSHVEENALIQARTAFAKDEAY